MAHIVPLIIDRIVETIQTTLVDTAVDTDDARITIVKSGLLQEQKLQRRIALGVIGGDREFPNMFDGIQSLESHPDIGFSLPSREGFGGPQAWWRRGIITFEAFLTREGLGEVEARDAAYTALGRVMKTVEETAVGDLVDEFGERAIYIFVPSNTMSESGGGPSKFIFRGKIQWMCATSKP